MLCWKLSGSLGLFRAWATCLLAWPYSKPISAPACNALVCLFSHSGSAAPRLHPFCLRHPSLLHDLQRLMAPVSLCLSASTLLPTWHILHVSPEQLGPLSQSHSTAHPSSWALSRPPLAHVLVLIQPLQDQNRPVTDHATLWRKKPSSRALWPWKAFQGLPRKQLWS